MIPTTSRSLRRAGVLGALLVGVLSLAIPATASGGGGGGGSVEPPFSSDQRNELENPQHIVVRSNFGGSATATVTS